MSRLYQLQEWLDYRDEVIELDGGRCRRCGRGPKEGVILHPKWDPLAVGTDCCDRLTGSDVALNLRRKIDRRKNFLSSTRWTQTRGGIHIRQKQMEFAVRSSPKGYYIELEGHCGKDHYPNTDSAKTKIFELVEGGIAEKFLRTRKTKDQ